MRRPDLPAPLLASGLVDAIGQVGQIGPMDGTLIISNEFLHFLPFSAIY